MDISRSDGPEPIYHLSGKLSFADNDTMRPLIEDVGQGSGRTVILDLGQLDYVDSFGIGLFLVALDEVNKAGNHLVVKNVHGAVKRIFALANLDTLLHMENAPAASAVARKVITSASNNASATSSLCVGEVSEDGLGGFRLALSGRFTFNDNEAFAALLEAVAFCAGAQLELDLRGLEFMDSAGLSMILIARDEAERNATRLVLHAPTGRVSQLLRLAAVDTLVPIRD